ncbi:acyltransferase [Sphingomonas sp. LB-2]|uniref:acyltransferase family protein n=1 Tax=Sphingomonas caeni TaxID=2984949 RepID=UPI0022320F44|nr:acyltransferase [Sphingomonas caeni]MCW3848192.1 acyltransferase [Sphingomonas caeni]
MDAGASATPHRIAYRPEIDGLRGIAVAVVILDHARMDWIPGGFLGVDIFFVISGYLITGILMGELAGGDFSFLRFYERRARRILPALLVMLLLTVPVAIRLLIPDDLDAYGRSLAATAAFANNILLTGTANYFATFSDFKPLIHSWSLGVEEQYYLLVPALMLAAWRIGRARAIWWGAVAASAASFLLCLWLAHRWGPANFFLLPTRVWELGAGALAVLAQPRLRALAGSRGGQALAMLGLVMAVVPLFLFVQQMKLPDWESTVPVAGTALLLVFARAGEPAARLLAVRPLVWLGLISYSAYLYHQPIFAFVAASALDEPSRMLSAALILPVLVCAWLSWRFVEQPFRDPAQVSARTLWIATGAGTALALAAGLVLITTHGFASSRPDLLDTEGGYVRPANVAFNRAALEFANRPLPATRERPRLLVIGDSFARDFISMGQETHRFDGWAVSFIPSKLCNRIPDRKIAEVMRADLIVLSDRLLPETLSCFGQRVKRLHGVTRAPIIILGTKSFGWSNNAPLMLPPERRFAWRALPLERAVAINAAAKHALAGETYIDLLGKLTDAQGRVPLFTPQGKLISWDRQHLTRPGAAYIGAILFRDPAFAMLRPRP